MKLYITRKYNDTQLLIGDITHRFLSNGLYLGLILALMSENYHAGNSVTQMRNIFYFLGNEYIFTEKNLNNR